MLVALHGGTQVMILNVCNMLHNVNTFGVTQKQLYTKVEGSPNEVTEQLFGEIDLSIADFRDRIVLCCSVARNSEQSPSWESNVSSRRGASAFSKHS